MLRRLYVFHIQNFITIMSFEFNSNFNGYLIHMPKSEIGAVSGFFCMTTFSLKLQAVLLQYVTKVLTLNILKRIYNI